MKTKFITLVCLLIFSRFCDLYSTSLWFFDNPTGETNPLYKFFNIGWTGLVIVNVIVTGLVIYALYFFYFLYNRPKILLNEAKNYKELASLHYFNSTNQFYQIFYKSPKNKKVLIAHFGFVFTIVIIIGSFLATIHNLCQYYNIDFYNQFRIFVGKPIIIIYSLMLISLVITYRQLLISEYKNYSK